MISLGFFFGVGDGEVLDHHYLHYIYICYLNLFLFYVFTRCFFAGETECINIYISISYNSQRRTTYVWNVSVSLLYYIFQNVYDGNYLVTKKTQVTVPDHRRVVMVCCTEAQLMIPQLKSVKCEPRYKTYLCESSVPKIYPNYTSQSL